SNSHACPMMIGPEPMMRILWMSVRLGIFHHREEFLEQVIRVMRPGRRFGMVLDAERRNGTMLETFHSVVVQIDVRDSDIVHIETLGIHSEPMILCRDLDLIAIDVEHRMVSTVMSELELERASA